MKKYVKPVLFYEHFELSQHIADCAWEMNTTAEENCTANPDQSKLPGAPENAFTTSCVYVPEDYCYTTGAPAANVFNS